MQPESPHHARTGSGLEPAAAPLDYATPPQPSPPRRRRRARRAVAVALLVIGLFFGLAETAVFVLAIFALGPFDDMRHKPLAARAAEMIPVLVLALSGYGVAVIGYFLDRARVRSRPGRAER